MKFIDEFRDKDAVRVCAEAIAQAATRPWRIMEICGGQTHAFLRYGIDQMLPPGVELLHGPGCPVCVTPAHMIDAAIAIAARPDVILCSFGDMMRVPGAGDSLLSAKAQGADIRMVYSPLDAVAIARDRPDREVVFFAIGFETTAPATAMTVLEAERLGLGNFSLLVAHVLVPPAIEAILEDPGNGVDGFLAAGHVCTIMGTHDYEPIAGRLHIPIVVTGFEPLDLLQGLYLCIRQLEAGRAVVENQYRRSVRADGNRAARAALEKVFVPCDQSWRGIGDIPGSGLALAPRYARYDAQSRFGAPSVSRGDTGPCISGAVLRGVKKPHDCPAFGGQCTPEHPLGATMVSSEGACAAYYRYRRTA